MLWWIEVGLLVVLIPLAVRAGAKALHSVIQKIKEYIIRHNERVEGLDYGDEWDVVEVAEEVVEQVIAERLSHQDALAIKDSIKR